MLQGIENVPHSNYDSQDLSPELLYEPQELNNSQLLPSPMPELGHIKTGRSPHFATSSTSESGSHRSPAVEVHTTQELPEEPEHPEEEHPSQASPLSNLPKIRLYHQEYRQASHAFLLRIHTMTHDASVRGKSIFA